jgi:DNA-binding LacI/PurR family transcriptional regulator/signal transduction histidine kinase
MESAKRPRIGFLALDLTNTFNELLLDGVRNRCNELELELVVFHGGRLGAPEEVESTQNLLYNFIPEAELDGLLFSNVFSFMDQDEIDLFFSRLPDIPKVFLIQDINKGPTVRVRNTTGFTQLLEHLILVKDCRKFGVIKGPLQNADSVERSQALNSVFQAHNIALPDDQVFQGTFSVTSGKEGVQDLIQKKDLDLDALICFNDNMAIGAVEELQRTGFRIPQDLIVTGFDNSRESRSLIPPLTTVSFPMYQLGQKGVETLFNCIQGGICTDDVWLETKFIPRRSSGLENRENWIWRNPSPPAGLVLQGPCDSLETAFKQLQGNWFNQFMQWVYGILHVPFIQKIKPYYRLIFFSLFDKLHHYLSQNDLDSLGHEMENLLEEEVLKKRPLDHWDEVLGMISHALSAVLPKPYPERLHRLISRAIPIVQQVQRSQILYMGIQDRYYSQHLYRLGQDLATVFNMNQIPEILGRALPELGLEHCIGVLFESEKAHQLKVFFGIQGEEILTVPQIIYTPKDFFAWLKEEYQGQYLLEALNIGERAMGFLVFDTLPGRGLIYRLLRHQISSAIMGSKLMNQIRLYNADLEEMVEKRTTDLEVAQKKLTKEMQERMEAEKNLLKQKNLDSLGLLAGGIAHDFNNLLTGILGNVSLLETGSLTEDESEKSFRDILSAGIQARSLTRQLLTFSKGGAPIKQALDLGSLLEESTRFQLRGTTIKRVLDIQDQLPPLKGDIGQLSQVINNILINAKQVIPVDGGILEVRCHRISFDRPRGILTEGEYVHLSIKDNGPGIPKGILGKIFDPYFSTKVDGSGLGLATSLAIIRRHRGGHTRGLFTG